MSVVVSFRGWRPSPRYDEIPWTEVRIQEAATEDGVYTTIDTVTFDAADLDDDPSDPEAREFTTEEGTATGLWYRLIFADADGDTDTPTSPIHNVDTDSTAYATTTELARILKIRSPTAEQTTAMQRVLVAAAGEINSEIDLDDDTGLETWQLRLVEEVNLERAVEHWKQQEAAFGLIAVGVDVPAERTARDSWERHALKLAPLKSQWGLA